MTDTGLAQALEVVPATARDAAGLARLHAALFDAPWSAASFEELLADAGALAFLALEGPAQTGSDPPPRRSSFARPIGARGPTPSVEAVGFVLGRLAADEAEVLSLGVAQAWQRRGLGRRLIEALARAAREMGARQLHLEVGAGNSAARALYAGLGFEESGRRRGYYVHPGMPPEDAINLRLAP